MVVRNDKDVARGHHADKVLERAYQRLFLIH